jgi:hypothetical protein
VEVLYVELGRRDVHHDGRAYRHRCVLHRGLAVLGLTLLEGATMSRHEEGTWKIVGVFMIVCSILTALIMMM